jgi:hypothetical protein
LQTRNKNKPAIISNTSSAASTRKIGRTNGKSKKCTNMYDFFAKERPWETNTMFRTCLTCHQLGCKGYSKSVIAEANEILKILSQTKNTKKYLRLQKNTIIQLDISKTIG